MKKNLQKSLEIKKIITTFAVPSINKREFSSAGSEHLPYKQRVGGSNPSTPTTISYLIFQVAFLFYIGFGVVVVEDVEQATGVATLLCNDCLAK